MSHVCDIILVTGSNEDEASELEVKPLNDYLMSRHHGARLERVDDHAGGNKAVQANVWMAAINYLNVNEFLEVFRGIKWDSPEHTQLMLKDENDNRFIAIIPDMS